MTRSIIQNEKRCYVKTCCKTTGLHLHHCFYGTANRRLSDEDGLVIWLCYEHHLGDAGVHNNKTLDNEIKAEAEEIYLETYNKTIEDFIKRYGKNYL